MYRWAGWRSCSHVKKNCAESAMPLKGLFQLSLDFGHFPKMWKSSKLLPVFKCGIENYRGLFILSANSKAFESILTDEIFNTYKRYIRPEQHGFFQGCSAATNLSFTRTIWSTQLSVFFRWIPYIQICIGRSTALYIPY